MKILFKYFLFCALPCTVFSLSAEQRQELKTVIENNFMKPNSIAGVGFSVFYKDDVFATGYGLKDVEQELEADNQTLFAIGSITKSFTATLVVKMLHETFPDAGDSTLDMPIQKLIPSFNFTMSDRYRSETISFRDLMAHKTCLDTIYIGRTFGSITDQTEFTYRTRFVEEICPFRTKYKYNNAMFTVAGEAIAALAKAKYIDLAKSLLQELGMSDTLIFQPFLDFNELPHAARGYYQINGERRRINSDLFKRMHIALPSGGLMPSSRDMAKYMEFHLNNGRINGKQVVPAVAMGRLRKASTPFDLSGIEGDYAYALGLVLGIRGRWQLVSHQGIWPPFTSRISLFPTLNLGIFTAVNGPGQDKPVKYKYIHDRIFEIVTGFSINGTSIESNITNEMGCQAMPHKGIWPSFSTWLHFFSPSKMETSPVVNSAGPNSPQTRTHVQDSGFDGMADGRAAVSKRNNKNRGQSRTQELFEGADSPPWKYSNINVDPADLIGRYGNGVQGEFEITFNASDPTQPLYLRFGLWGTGHLKKVANSDSTFYPLWDSDVVGDFLSFSNKLPMTTIDFGTPNFAIMTYDGNVIKFERDSTLQTLLSPKWSPGSCSPG